MTSWIRHFVDLPDEAATAGLGERLARLARPGDVFALEGELGVGKTTLARAFVQALAGSAIEVPSPTFTLAQTYDSAAGVLWHFDLFRLSHPDEVLELGVEEAFDTGISLVEWPDRLGPWLPAHRLIVALAHAGAGRVATLSGGGDWCRRLKDGLGE
jgi:tRNA threonylcarbamoyladenosine biosynthesis protein TsaE